MKFVVLGLGCNLGDRLDTLARAIQSLATGDSPVLSKPTLSELFESEALLLPGSPRDWNIPFVNLAVSGFTELPPEKLLESVKSIERTLGRQARDRWAPREIDIDILTFSDENFESPALSIPHPQIARRPFAVWPLAALAPKQTIRSTSGELVSAAKAARSWKFLRSEIPCRTWRAPHEIQSEFHTNLESLGINDIPVAPGPIPNTELIGIINATPDSFSDGNIFLNPEKAAAQALSLYEQGARVLDIGAESTRPNATPLSPQEEWTRLSPVLEAIKSTFAGNSLAPVLSVDTRHPVTAAKALEAGAHWINDVTGFSDPGMLAAVKGSQCSVVAMHSLGIPPSKDRILSEERSAFSQILEWGHDRIDALTRAGISRDRIILDPGIGFGKTPAQSVELLAEAEKLLGLGSRILIGHSRKSFLTLFTDRPAAERDSETAVLSSMLCRKGVHYLRVHNVGLNATALAAVSI
jgi:2-amino-4-hydroxy-6-hydroxymethyldihydropteridine diphosphokinase/dihydropteroate synthase